MNDFERVAERLTISEVAQEYTPIVKKGGRIVCICPFHNEKTPSMTLSDDKGLFYCFGCQASGNIFSFVAKMDNLSMKESLEKLALKSGIELTPFVGSGVVDEALRKELEEGFKILALVADLYNQILMKYISIGGNYVADYILSRKLTAKTILDFKIGYAPSNNYLLKFFKDKKLSIDVGLSIGVLIRDDYNTQEIGSSRDKFKDRLMIPIIDSKGRVAGFTGRVFPNDTIENRPKYLNSPESKFFTKSNILFGLNLSKQSINKLGKIIVVEGNMDVVACHQYSVTNVVATQGTAITETQIRALKKIDVQVIAAFDNDNAGIIAEKKLVKACITNDLDIFKLVLPSEYKDVDQFLSNVTAVDGYVSLVDSLIVPYIDYLIDSSTQKSNNNEGILSTDIYKQKAAIKEIVSLLSPADKSNNRLGRYQVHFAISQATGIPLDYIEKIEKQGVKTFVKSNPKIQDGHEVTVVENNTTNSNNAYFGASNEVANKDRSLFYAFIKLLAFRVKDDIEFFEKIFSLLSFIDNEMFEGENIMEFISIKENLNVFEVEAENVASQLGLEVYPAYKKHFKDQLKNLILKDGLINNHIKVNFKKYDYKSVIEIIN